MRDDVFNLALKEIKREFKYESVDTLFTKTQKRHITRGDKRSATFVTNVSLNPSIFTSSSSVKDLICPRIYLGTMSTLADKCVRRTSSSNQL